MLNVDFHDERCKHVCLYVVSLYRKITRDNYWMNRQNSVDVIGKNSKQLEKQDSVRRFFTNDIVSNWVFKRFIQFVNLQLPVYTLILQSFMHAAGTWMGPMRNSIVGLYNYKRVSCMIF
jgi:hypothetical protein